MKTDPGPVKRNTKPLPRSILCAGILATGPSAGACQYYIPVRIICFPDQRHFFKPVSKLFFAMNWRKDDIKGTMIVLLSWLFALSLLYIMYLKFKLLFH